MIELDRELTDLGMAWRAEQAEPQVDVHRVIHRARRRTRILATTVSLVMVGGIAAVGVVVTRDTPSRSVQIPPQNSPTSVPTTTTSAQPIVPTAGVFDFSSQSAILQRVVAKDGTVWALGSSPGGGQGDAPIFELDASRGAVVRTLHVPVASPFALSVTNTAIWVRGEDNRSTYLVKLDRHTGQVLKTKELSLDGGLAVTHDAVWVMDGDKLLRLDPENLHTIATVPLPGGLFPPLDISAGPLGLWLTGPYDQDLRHVNTTTNTIDRTFTVADSLSVVVQLDGSLWVLHDTAALQSELVEVEPTTGTITRHVPLGRRGYDLTTDGTSIYVATIGPDTAQRVDPTTATVTPLAVSPRVKSAATIAYEPATNTLWIGGGALLAETNPK